VKAPRYAKTRASLVLLAVALLTPPGGVARAAEGDGAWRDFMPPARRGASAAFDAARDRMILFGGADQSLRDETWSFDGATSSWDLLAPGGSRPRARSSAAMVYDAARDRIWTYGGYASNGLFSVLWALDLGGAETWSQLLPQGTIPAARGAAGLVLDTTRDRLVLFGGQISFLTTTGASGDVWTISPSADTLRWTRIIPSGSAPQARWGAIVVYDAPRDRMVVLGGRDRNSVFSDAWELRFSPSPAWTQLTTFTGRPPARDGALGVLDAGGNRIVTVGGVDPVTGASSTDVWAFRLSGIAGWNKLAATGDAPLDLATACAVFDAGNQRMLIHGGGRPPGAEPTYVSNQTWALDLAPVPAWSRVAPAYEEPAPRFGQATAFDPATGGLWIFGGRAARDGVGADSAELWRARLAPDPAWARVSPAGPGPLAREEAIGVFDPGSRRLFVFGGWNRDQGLYYDDTWSVGTEAPLAWAHLSGTGLNVPAPPARRGHTSIYDPLRRSWIVFGGVGPDSAFGDVWEYPFATQAGWRRLSPIGERPAPRSSARAIFDAPRDRMIVFGGTASGRSLDDVWALSLGAAPRWSRLAPTGAAPGPRSDCGVVYDDVRQRMLVWGGYQISDDVIFSDFGVWALSLSGEPVWSVVAEAGMPPYPASSGSVVFDAARDRMVTYGGTQTFGEYLADFRVLEFAGAAAPRSAWLVAAQAAPDGVRLLWQTDALAPTNVGIEKRVETAPEGGTFLHPARRPGDWFGIGEALPDANGMVAWTDPDVGPGGVYHYRLDLAGVPAGEATVSIPRTPQLGIDGVAPLPTTGTLTLAFRSTGAGPIELSLYDVRGRRVAARDLGSLPEGPQSVTWEIPPARSGVYFLTLTQGANEATRKIVVVR
jgi:hypothetical protein